MVNTSGASTTTLRYDPLGRLYEISGAPTGITRFLYDGDEMVAEYNSAGVMLRRYAHGSAVDDPVVWYEGASLSQPRWLHSNHQGSIIGISDASGYSIGINSYDEFGIPGVSNIGRFQYTGQAWIPELRMYHYKARIYSPTLGRFLQTDPIGYDDDINLYAYVGNDTINKIDTDGKRGNEVHWARRALRVAAAGASADLAVPEPTDAFWPKLAAEAGIVAIFAGVEYFADDKPSPRRLYVVNIQFQGTDVTDRYVSLQSDKPIKLKAVNQALTQLADSASRSDQKELFPAFVGASKAAKRIADAGGIGASNTNISVPGASGNGSKSRVDIEIKLGERNIVY